MSDTAVEETYTVTLEKTDEGHGRLPAGWRFVSIHSRASVAFDLDEARVLAYRALMRRWPDEYPLHWRVAPNVRMATYDGTIPPPPRPDGRLRIESDGTLIGTHLLVDDVRVTNATRATWTIDVAGGLARATVEFTHVPVGVEGALEIA